MYCSAHTCSFALRRGATADAVTGAKRTAVESQVVAAAEALSTVPASFDKAHLDALRAHLSPSDIEWVVLSVAMMGFLNKFMDAIGVDLEPEALADVSELIEPTGWTSGQHLWDESTVVDRHAPRPAVDSMATYARVLKQAPAAVKLERSWTKDLPSQPDALRRYLLASYNFDEPAITELSSKKAARALGAMLRENLDPKRSEVGMPAKALAGVVFTSVVGNERLTARLEEFALARGLSPEACGAAAGFAAGGEVAELAAFADKESAVIRLAAAIAPSPANVTTEIRESSEALLTSAEIIEISVFVSVMQCLHRLDLYLNPA